jgi:multiple sugar transport system permease protein/putative aldouronate transport system permease protein
MLKQLFHSSSSSSTIRNTGADRIFLIVNTTMLIIGFLIVLYPLIYVVSASFSSPDAVISGRVKLLPVEFNLKAYEAVFKYERVWTGFANSLFYAVVGTVLNVVMTIMAAYPLSRRDLPGKNFLMLLFVFTMMFSGGLIPTYLVVKQLGLYNTRWAMILLPALSVWNLLICVTYFRTAIPVELLEAAQLDGCTDFQYLTQILLPLSKPIIAVLA